MRIVIIALAVILILILLRSCYETHHFKIKRYMVKNDRIKKSVNIAFISDLHNCCYGSKNENIIAAIKNEKPDFLIIGGDLIVGKRKLGKNPPEKYFNNAVDFLKGVSGDFPVFYTYGNHETRVKEGRNENPLYDKYMESISSLVEKQMITTLNNDVKFEKGVVISGLEVSDEAYKGAKGFDKEAKNVFEHLMSSVKDKKDCFHILVSHSPDFFDFFKEEDIDLVLAGHYHGGAVRLPIVRGVVSRNYKLFPPYSYGVYEKNNTRMILTGGLGDHTIHFRLFNMPEVVMIRLEKT